MIKKFANGYGTGSIFSDYKEVDLPVPSTQKGVLSAIYGLLGRLSEHSYADI